MTFPSHQPPVPLFHSLKGGTVEQTLDQRNSSWNMSGTASLKGLANKALERNKGWNKPGTGASKPVPHPDQPVPLRGTKGSLRVPRPIPCETFHETKNGSWAKSLSLHPSSVLEDYEERLAIAEYDGHQTPLQAERIAYQDAFINVLVTLPQEAYENSHGEYWLDARITAAKEWLQAQNLFQPK